MFTDVGTIHSTSLHLSSHSLLSSAIYKFWDVRRTPNYETPIKQLSHSSKDLETSAGGSQKI